MPVDYREDTEGSVDTWEILDQQRTETPGDFEVPPGVSAITRIGLYSAPDVAADAIVRYLSAFRLTGNAIKTIYKPYYFLGHGGGSWQTTDGMHASRAKPVEYNVNIPVTPGATFQAAGKFLGEDTGDTQLGIKVGYNVPHLAHLGPVVKAADFREDDLADAAEALVLIDQDPDDVASNFTVPAGVSTILGAAVSVGMDVASVTRFAHQVELDGTGLNSTVKPQRWPAFWGLQELDTAGGETLLLEPEVEWGNWPVFPDKQIIARGGMVEDDYGAGTLGVNLLYG